jgi:cyclophilin family peptidyl-prolyl cis-trans isomerase
MGTFFKRLGAGWLGSLLRVGAICPRLRRRELAPLPIAKRPLLILVAAMGMAADASANTIVRLDYNRPLANRLRRTAFIELFDDRPLTRDNFLQYVDGGLYDNSLVHRLARNFVLQAGGYYPQFQEEPSLPSPEVKLSLNPDYQIDLDGNLSTPNPTVVNEYGNSPTRSNVRGTVAMARRGGMPNSADSEWFINLNDNTGLDSVDGGFTVFGHVIGDGMTLYDTYNNGLGITNLNEDADNDGVRDIGPFYLGANDGVPVYFSEIGILVMEKVQQVDYLGYGLSTEVPEDGLTFSTRDAFIDTGTVFTGPGELGVGVGRTLGIRGGVSLQRNLVNQGTLAPGLELGSITAADYFQFPSGTLEIQLFGTVADTKYDRVVATDTAWLAGTLDVSLVGGFNPGPGSSFTVLTAGSIVGAFSALELPMLSPGLVWDYNRSQTSITLSVAAADFNRDGVVDAADYVLWRSTQNSDVTPFSGADGNGDGRVDADDLQIWQANIGNLRGTTGGGGSIVSVVPEPSSALLLLSAGLFTLGVSPRRRSLRGPHA